MDSRVLLFFYYKKVSSFPSWNACFLEFKAELVVMYRKNIQRKS